MPDRLIPNHEIFALGIGQQPALRQQLAEPGLMIGLLLRRTEKALSDEPEKGL